jgi:hypothetical protein
VEKLRATIDSVPDVLRWVEDVRNESTRFIDSLIEQDFHRVPPNSEFGMSVAQWLMITVAHGAVHIGRIQMLRAMLEGRPDNPC